MLKKGVSQIIVTVIMITIVLAAIGVVWVIIQNVLQGGAGDIDLSSKCLKVNLQATRMDCTAAATCTVTVKRNSGGDEEFGGMKVVFSNRTSGNTGSNVADFSSNIQELGTATSPALTHGMAAPEKPNTVEVTAYFLDESGSEQLCSQGRKFEF